MKPGDREYDLLVEAKREEIRMHKVTTLTESECAQEVKDITGGVFNQHPIETPSYLTGMVAQAPELPIVLAEPKRRGRPKGSRNKPKV